MSVEKRVKEIIARELKYLNLKVEEIELETRFIKDLLVDSLDTVGLVVALEEEFKISIPDEEAEKMLKVRDAVEFIEEKITVKS